MLSKIMNRVRHFRDTKIFLLDSRHVIIEKDYILSSWENICRHFSMYFKGKSCLTLNCVLKCIIIYSILSAYKSVLLYVYHPVYVSHTEEHII